MNLKNIKLRNLFVTILKVFRDIFRDHLFLILLILTLVLNITSWIYWTLILKDPSKLQPIFYTSGLLVFNFILSLALYRREKAASYLAMFIAGLAQILLLVLLRYFYLVAGLL